MNPSDKEVETAVIPISQVRKPRRKEIRRWAQGREAGKMQSLGLLDSRLYVTMLLCSHI